MGECDLLRGAQTAVVVGDDEGRGDSVQSQRVLLNARWRVSHARNFRANRAPDRLALGPSSAPATLEGCFQLDFLHYLPVFTASPFVFALKIRQHAHLHASYAHILRLNPPLHTLKDPSPRDEPALIRANLATFESSATSLTPSLPSLSLFFNPRRNLE